MIAPKDLLQQLPLSSKSARFVSSARNEVREILNGANEKLIVIVGPCSIHHANTAISYGKKLKQLAKDVEDSLLLVMRVYFEKPRTKLGWKGLLFDPDLNGSHQFEKGVRLSRQLLLDLADLEVPTATEFLTPLSAHYLGDLITWGCIGARTAASPIHRQMASGLPMPIGIKNCTMGNIDTAVNGVFVASHAHYHLDTNHSGLPQLVQTQGNPDAHVVLRGGEEKPNYDSQSLNYTFECLEKIGLSPRVIIDCSHGNACRNHENQPFVFKSVLNHILTGDNRIKGFILESNHKAGKQPFEGNGESVDPEISITDPCLDWPMTASLIQWAAHKITTERLIHA